MTDTLLERADEIGSTDEDPLATKKAQHAGIIAQLKSEHRFIKYWDIDGFGLIVCRRMRRSEILSFTIAANKANKPFELNGDSTELVKVNETIVKSMCIWPKDAHAPTSDFLKRLFDEYPTFQAIATVEIQKLNDEGITDLGKD